MIILSIDPGYDKLGYCFCEKRDKSYPNNFHYLSSGLIKTKKTDPIEVRLSTIYKELSRLIDKNKPTVVVVEKLFFFKNQKTAMKVNFSQGVIFLLVAQKKITLEQLTPLQIKEIVTGYGRADKKAIKKMLDMTLKIDKKIKEDDETDAIACGYAFVNFNKNL